MRRRREGQVVAQARHERLYDAAIQRQQKLRELARVQSSERREEELCTFVPDASATAAITKKAKATVPSARQGKGRDSETKPALAKKA